jgi:hypothetical protein
MQTIPADGLKLTFFDSVELEQLRGLLSRYRPMADSDPERARRLVETWLLSVAVGVKNVHALRRVDEELVSEYVIPTLEDDEEIGRFTGTLASGNGGATAKRPEGVDVLLGAAFATGIRDKRREEADADKLEAPNSHVKTATRQLERALDALRVVWEDEEFDSRKRKSLGVAFGKLRKAVHALEVDLEKHSTPTR